MGLPGVTEAGHLSDQVLELVRLAFFDFVGSSFRASDGPYPYTFSGSGDTELDGTYPALDRTFINLSPISHTKENSNTVSITLSGLISLDSSTMNLIGDRSKWVGRSAIIWFMLLDDVSAQIGNPWRHYTGHMVNASYGGSGDSSYITITIENYLAALSEPSNRSYMSQEDYDSGDLSAGATLAAVNTKNPLTQAPNAQLSNPYGINFGSIGLF